MNTKLNSCDIHQETISVVREISLKFTYMCDSTAISIMTSKCVNEDMLTLAC